METQLVRLADDHFIHRRHGVGIRAHLAGEVAAIRSQRGVVEAVLAVGNRLRHEHVGASSGAQQRNEHTLGKHGHGERTSMVVVLVSTKFGNCRIYFVPDEGGRAAKD